MIFSTNTRNNPEWIGSLQAIWLLSIVCYANIIVIDGWVPSGSEWCEDYKNIFVDNLPNFSLKLFHISVKCQNINVGANEEP